MQIITKNFDLKHTLECGQLFRYFEKNGYYYLTVRDKIIKLKQEKHRLFFKGCSESFLRNYFSLDEDYKKAIDELKKDKQLSDAIQKYKGMRIVRQDPWECLISYICSAAANIPKIQNNVYNLSKSFGRKIILGNVSSYSFPTKDEIKRLCTIKNCGCGFRSKYIFEASRKVDENWLNSLREMEYEDAKKELTKLPGVGEKIADCVLLFSLGFREAFPVDVWIKRAMEELYFNREKTNEKKIREFAKKKWGKNSGYAQQFLYHSVRNE